MLMLYELHAFATGAENVLGGEDEPDPNDFADNADYEVAMKDYNIMIEKLNKGIRVCKAWVVETLLRSPGFLDKAQRIINATPEWTLRQIHQFVYCGFIAKTPKQVEKARKAFEECFQGFKESIANFASRITNSKIIYESLSDEEVTDYEFLRRMMENLNVKFKQYGLILLQDFKRTKALNDAEPDAALHIAFPPAHNVVQDLEGLEADLRTDDRQENLKSDHSQRKNNGNNNKKIKGNHKSDKSDQVFTVSKADFERLNSWKATKSKQTNGPKKPAKSTANDSKPAGICYNFQDRGECKRQNCPYQHVVKHSENNSQMVPYRGSQSRRGGRGPRGQANISRGFEEDYRSYDDREYIYDNYNPPNSRTHFSRPHDTLPTSDFFDGPPRDYGFNTGTRNVRAMRSEGSRHGLSILMVTDTSGNFETYNTFSNSTIRKKYYTPLSHNTVFDGFFCSENPRHAMYKYHIQGLIIPHHYYICMFKLIDQLTKYCPKQIIYTDTGMIINAHFPVTRCEFATVPLQPRSKHIDYRIRHPKCRFNWV